MKFYFMRHGEAVWHQGSDASRPLSDNGIIRLRHQLAQQAAAMQDVTCIVHSPLLRAQQTAALASDALGVSDLRESAVWTPEGSLPAAFENLEAFVEQNPDAVPLFVTHNPLVSYFVGEFCGTGHEPFDTGSIAALSADWPAAGMATLNWKV